MRTLHSEWSRRYFSPVSSPFGPSFDSRGLYCNMSCLEQLYSSHFSALCNGCVILLLLKHGKLRLKMLLLVFQTENELQYLENVSWLPL